MYIIIVILPEKYYGTLKSGSEIEACMGIALWGSTLSKVADDTFIVLGPLVGICCTYSCQHKKSVYRCADI